MPNRYFRVVDLESTEWDIPLCAVVVDSFGNRKVWIGPNSHRDCALYCRKHPGTYYAHNGGGYDFLLMANHVDPAEEVILTGSRVLAMSWGSGKNRVVWRDTFPMFLSSLKKIGEGLGHTKKIDVDPDMLGDMNLGDVVDYCSQDCEVLVQALKDRTAWAEAIGAEPAHTSGAMAIAAWKALSPGEYDLAQYHALDAVTEVGKGLSALNGGRTECWARGVVAGVYCYDIVSSYPARYADRDLGLGLRKATKSDKDAVWWCEWTWPHATRIPPARGAEGLGAIGKQGGWLVQDEIDDFVSCGVKVRRVEGFAPIEMAPIGQDFARMMFEKKKENAAYKVTLNSFHGKLSEKSIREVITLSEMPKEMAPEKLGKWWRGEKIVSKKDGAASAHQQPIAAAQILGRARSALWRAMRGVEQVGGEVYYCDTDSIFCSLPPDDFSRAIATANQKMGKNLGEWSCDGGPYCGIFAGPKIYAMIDPTTQKVVKEACKGVPVKRLDRATFGALKAPNVPDGIGGFRRSRPQSRYKEKGEDLRRDVYLAAAFLDAPCVVDGVTTFVRGAGKGKWGRDAKMRVVKAVHTGKKIKNATDWRYV